VRLLLRYGRLQDALELTLTILNEVPHLTLIHDRALNVLIHELPYDYDLSYSYHL